MSGGKGEGGGVEGGENQKRGAVGGKREEGGRGETRGGYRIPLCREL